MIHNHTMTQIKTVQDPLKLLKSTNITANASLTTETVTTTMPTTTGGAVVIPASTLSYLKIVPLLSTVTSNSPVIRVTGWSKSEDGTYWIPTMLFSSDSATAPTLGTAVTVNSATLYPISNITKKDGDAKIYAGNNSSSTGMLLIDTLGCQLIKIEFAASAATTANAFYGAI